MSIPDAAAYHHQRCPLSISRSSEITKWTKRECLPVSFNGVRCATLREIAGETTECCSSAGSLSPATAAMCLLLQDLAGSKRWKNTDAASANPTATAIHTSRINKTCTVQSKPFHGNVRTACSP